LFVHLIRQAGVLTVVGALVEAVSLVIRLGGVSDALVGTAGVAIGLRVVGAAALVAHTSSILLVGERRPAAVASERALAVVGGGSFSGAIAAPENKPVAPAPGDLRTGNARDQIEPSAWLFAGLIAVSYAFDGHTVTKGNRLLTSLVDVIHVAGGAVWLGGLICLVLLSRQRGSNSQGSDFVATVVRYSVVAAVALAAVGAAGLVLTVTILDSVSELWATAWGRILIAKVLIVGVAVAAGAFNHFVLIPEMQSISAHDDARQSLVRTMIIELTAIGVAVALTAFLVVAAS
jgi:copper transport protein